VNFLTLINTDLVGRHNILVMQWLVCMFWLEVTSQGWLLTHSRCGEDWVCLWMPSNVIANNNNVKL